MSGLVMWELSRSNMPVASGTKKILLYEKMECKLDFPGKRADK